MPIENKTKKQIWKKWWFWALIVAVLIGGVIEFTEPETEESADNVALTETIEPTASTEPETEAPTETEEPATTEESTATEEKNIREAIEEVIAKENLETFNYEPSNNFCLIKFKGSENLTNNMTVKGMYLDMFNILKAIQPIIDTDIDFNVTYPLIDQYGNTEDVIVIKATFLNDTIKKINFENAIWENIPSMADDWWNHNAVNITN